MAQGNRFPGFESGTRGPVVHGKILLQCQQYIIWRISRNIINIIVFINIVLVIIVSLFLLFLLLLLLFLLLLLLFLLLLLLFLLLLLLFLLLLLLFLLLLLLFLLLLLLFLLLLLLFLLLLLLLQVSFFVVFVVTAIVVTTAIVISPAVLEPLSLWTTILRRWGEGGGKCGGKLLLRIWDENRFCLLPSTVYRGDSFNRCLGPTEQAME